MKGAISIIVIFICLAQMNLAQRGLDFIFPDQMKFHTTPMQMYGRPNPNIEYSAVSPNVPFSLRTSQTNNPKPPATLTDAVTKFSWDIFRGTKLPINNENLVMSPVIIQILLSVLSSGAEGETKNQLKTVVGGINVEELLATMRDTASKSSAVLRVVNGIFVDGQQSIDNGFINKANKVNVAVHRVNFQQEQKTRDLINAWASNATNGLIPKLFSDSYNLRDLRLALTSAIYFHGSWKTKFNKMKKPHLFHYDDKTSKPIDFLVLEKDLSWYDFDNGLLKATVVEIPYENDAYSMVIVLPDQLDTFIKSLTFEDISKIWQELSNRFERSVILKMPKFDITSRISVVNTLLKMGLTNLFTINSNLPNIVKNENFQVSDILQQAVMKVDETGTTAAAATGAVLIPLSVDGADEHFITVDRPFLAMIFDKKAGLPIFIAKVYNP